VGVPAFALLGDVRYALLALTLLSAWLLARAVRGPSGELGALLVLYQPRAFFVLEQSWSEPLTLAAFALVLFFLRRGRALLAAAALGLLLVSKQYSPFLAAPLLFAFPPGKRLRA